MKFNQTLSIFCFLLFSLPTFAQSDNCGDIQPAIQCPMDLTTCEMETVQPFTVTTTSNLPDLEYAIVDYAKPSTSGTGPSIVAIDQDGIFLPSDYNLSPGNDFGVIPFAYDLAAIQSLLDDLLKGYAVNLPPFLVVTCCDAITQSGAPDICADLTMAGIMCGSGVSSISDAFVLLGAGGPGGDTLSIVDLELQIADINMMLNDPANPVPADCGGGSKIAYAYGAECTFYLVPDTINITMPHTMSELVEAADLVTSNTIVNAPDVVEYNANICIELQPGFETVIGADFTAEIDDHCN